MDADNYVVQLSKENATLRAENERMRKALEWWKESHAHLNTVYAINGSGYYWDAFVYLNEGKRFAVDRAASPLEAITNLYEAALAGKETNEGNIAAHDAANQRGEHDRPETDFTPDPRDASKGCRVTGQGEGRED